jgi:transposase
MAEPQCPGCRALERRVAELEAQLKRVTELLEQQRRAGKRQAAPFAKGPPKQHPKKPGRKPGADYGPKAHREPPPPEQIDEVHQALLPPACPDCGGALEPTHVSHQYQVEIPRKPIHRRFDIHVGQCLGCRRRVQGRHPLQTSDALGAAASQLGPDAQAAVVTLNKQAGLPHGKVSRVLGDLFGVPLTPGGSAHVVLRAARRCEPVYAGLCEQLKQADRLGADETGWHVGGRNARLHVLAGEHLTAYVIDPTRSGAVAERILGADYAGVLIHDGWAPYDHFEQAGHQQCLAHLLRRCGELLETASRGAVLFPRRVKGLMQQALELRDRHEAGLVSDHGKAVARGRLLGALLDAVFPAKVDAANERLAKHLWAHKGQLLTFLEVPGLDATNWRAELAIRAGVVLRKVWGGNRTWVGARAQAVLMSVVRTCWQQGQSALEFFSRRLRGQPVLLAAPP